MNNIKNWESKLDDINDCDVLFGVKEVPADFNS
jgi:hypothetical protein